MKKILIVDDEHRVREVLKSFLTHKGFEVAEAENAPLALAQLGYFQPDAMLLDIIMPGMDGLEVLARARETYPALCIIMLTGVDDDEVGKTAVQSGATDYLTKPVNLAQLETHLRVHLLFQEEN